MQRIVTTVQIRNNPTSVPPLELILKTNGKTFRGIAVAGMFLIASGGAPGYTYAASGLPAGLSLDAATGEITGTPATIAHNVISATAADSSTNSTTLDFTIDVVNRLVFTPPLPYRGEVGIPYKYTFNVIDESGLSGTGGISFAVTDGSLPTSLSINGQRITGTPSAQTFGIPATTVTATDSASGETLDITFILPINDAIVLNVVSGLSGAVGTDITIAAVDVGLGTGVGPYKFTIDESTLPAGVTASIQTASVRFGVVTAIASQVVSSTFDVVAIDSLGATDTVSVPIDTFLVNQQLIMRDDAGDVADPNPATITIKSSDNSVTIDTSASSGNDTIYDLSTSPGSAGTPGVVDSVVAGTGISVDNTDPANPIVSAIGGGSGGSIAVYFA